MISPRVIPIEDKLVEDLRRFRQAQRLVREAAAEHVGDDEIRGSPAGEQVGDYLNVQVGARAVVDQLHEGVRTRADRKTSGVGDLAGGPEVHPLEHCRLGRSPGHALGDGHADGLVDVVVGTEEVELGVVGKDSTQLDERAAVTKPALHLHLEVGGGVG